jgi:hypothetical protein
MPLTANTAVSAEAHAELMRHMWRPGTPGPVTAWLVRRFAYCLSRTRTSAQCDRHEPRIVSQVRLQTVPRGRGYVPGSRALIEPLQVNQGYVGPTASFGGQLWSETLTGEEEQLRLTRDRLDG